MTIEQHTQIPWNGGVKVGQLVRRTPHNMAMFKTPPSGEVEGEVLSIQYHGQDMFGSHIYTANVAWSGGQVYSCGTFFLEPVITKENGAIND